MLSDSDLIEIGVTSVANRHKILSAAAKLPPFNCHARKGLFQVDFILCLSKIIILNK